MPWPRYMAEHSDYEHLVFLEWLKMHQFEDIRIREKDQYECVVGDGPDAHMSQETWDRYAAKIAGAKWSLMNRKQGVSFDQ